jgi:hypothetical protein
MDRTARGTTTGWCDDGKQRSSGGIGGFRGNGTNAAVREHLDASLASMDIAATVPIVVAVSRSRIAGNEF